MKVVKDIIFLSLIVLAVSCSVNEGDRGTAGTDYARYFDILTVDSVPSVVVVSPYGTQRDTIRVKRPLQNIICMSTSHVACLSSIGADTVISAVSGLKYIADPDIRERNIPDIGYDSSLDYEMILSLNPDMVVTYTVSGAEPSYLAKLRSLGVPVLVIHDHLEDHPLARAEYIRFFGALTGCQEKADSVFDAVAERYRLLADRAEKDDSPVRVLMNIPYGDAWYIPGDESYMSRLIKDAGGVVLGAGKGRSSSDVISIEDAWALSRQADVWLNPGHCGSRDELSSSHPLFSSFGPMEKGLPIYNNTLRTTPEGGNDFYEGGVARPDLILEDLVRIFSIADHAAEEEVTFNYFKPLL